MAWRDANEELWCDCAISPLNSCGGQPRGWRPILGHPSMGWKWSSAPQWLLLGTLAHQVSSA